MVESSNTDVSSVILHLETLTNKYDQLLLKYKRAQAEYILFLKESNSQQQINPNPIRQINPDVNPNPNPNRQIIRTPGKNYKSATLLTNNRTDNIDKCEALCSANPLCTGATFSTEGNLCSTYGGVGTNYASNDTRKISIVPAPTKQSMSQNLKNLNEQLISLNDQILLVINTNQPSYETQQYERVKQKHSITKNGELLKKELDELKKIQKENQELDEKDAETKIILTQNHYIYIAVFIISLIVLFVFFKYVLGSSDGPVTPQVSSVGY